MRYLEIFNTDRYEDISLNQVCLSNLCDLSLNTSKWLALTPPELVKAHLDLDDATISQLSKTKPIVIGPAERS